MDTHHTVGILRPVSAEIKASLLGGGSSLRIVGSLLAHSLCWLYSTTTCACLLESAAICSASMDYKTAFSTQAHSLAAGIPSVLRNYNQLY